MIKQEKPFLAMDADFVLLDWCAGLKPFLAEKGIDNSHIDRYTGSTYYPTLEELFLDSDSDKCIELMKEFNDSKWIEHLPMLQATAKEHLTLLAQEVNIVVLTCLGLGADQAAKRTNNLVELYGDIFEEVICIEVRGSKEEKLIELAKTKNVIGFVDDREKHLKEGVNAGVSPILFVRNAPMPDTQYHVIDCLSQILDFVRNAQRKAA